MKRELTKKEKAIVEERKKKDLEKIKCVFRNYENQGKALEGFMLIKYGVKYENTFVDGNVYEIPRMVMDYINDNCSYPVYEWITVKDGDGSDVKKLRVKTMHQKYRFEPFGISEERHSGIKKALAIEEVDKVGSILRK